MSKHPQNNGQFQHRNRRHKELYRNYRIETHTHTHKMRNSVDDLNRRIERTQERIGELAERTIEIIKINN